MWLLSFFVGIATIGATTGADVEHARAPAATDSPTLEDECSSDTPEVDGSCGVSLRQLRATGSSVSVAEAEVAGDGAEPNSTDPPPANGTNDGKDDEHDDDNNIGVPGGWGEGAAFGDELKKNLTLHGDSGWYNPYHYHYHYHYSARRRRHHSHHYHTKNVYTLYHQTSPWVADLIVKMGFKPGSQGWCGGGIYFAKSADATETKAIGPDSHKGAIIQAGVDVGRVKYMPKQCDRSLNGWKVKKQGYDSVSFNPGDGPEFIVYDKSKVVWVKRIK